MARLQYPLERQGEFKGRVVFELLEVQPLEAGSIAELGFIEKVFSEDTISRIQKNTDDESTSGTSEIEKEKLKSDLKAADKQLQGDENRTYEKTGTTRNTGDRVVFYGNISCVAQLNTVTARLNGIPVNHMAGRATGHNTERRA